MIEFVLVTATLTALNIFLASSIVGGETVESEPIRTIAQTPSLLGAITNTQPIPKR